MAASRLVLLFLLLPTAWLAGAGCAPLPSAQAQYYHADGSVVATQTFAPIQATGIKATFTAGVSPPHVWLTEAQVWSPPSGEVTTQRFDAFGTPLAQTGLIPTYGYTGREPDATGLIYYRARYYDPALGRFTQRDPLGLADGLNPYAYVHDNPLNLTDPNGLLAREIGTWAQTDGIRYFNTGLDYVQGGLDVAGLAAQGPLEPFVIPIDLTNAGISALRGHYSDAALSASSAIPFVGIGANIAKVGDRAMNVVDVAKGVKAYDVGPVNVLKANSTPFDGLQIYHVGQSHPLSQAIQGYDPKNAPAIVLPAELHKAIPTVKGDFYGKCERSISKRHQGFEELHRCDK